MKFKYVFICGICLGIEESGIGIGDILIASQAWDYESGKITEGLSGDLIFSPEMNCLPTEQGIISRITEFISDKENILKISNGFNGDKPKDQIHAHIGPIASGPYVLSSKNYLKMLKSKDRKLIGIDMEGYGTYKAAQFNPQCHPVFVKGVSDYGDDTKTDEYREFAAYNSAHFVHDFIYTSL